MAEPAEQLDAAAQNSEVSAPVVGRPFQPGVSGNPGGRPKGLARKVRETLGDDDGSSLAGFWVLVMTDPNEKTEHRLLASKLLAERGWGKPAQFVPIDDADPLEMSSRETDEIAASFDARLDELADRRAKKSAGG